jgi:hypothetical protein
MPDHIFVDLPYQQTYDALKKDDQDKLKELMCSFVVSIANKVYNQTWEEI